MFKKMLSILLAFAMLLSMIPAGYAEDLEVVDEAIGDEDIVMIEEPTEEPVTADVPPVGPQESESGDERVTTPLTPGVEATAEFENGGETVYFSFTPETTAEYVFKSIDSNADPIGTLYDSNWNVLTDDFGGGGNRNFRIRYTLYAGETYYFGVETMQSIIASVTVLLEIYFENNFSAWAENSNVYTNYGDSAKLVVLVDGADLSGVSYRWSVLRKVTHGEGDDAWTSETYVDIDGATDSSYVTGPVTERETYRCIASDAYDNSLEVYFSVILDMHLTAEAVQTYVRVAPGETATLEVRASSDDPDKITYQWRDYREVTYGEGDNTWTGWEYVDIDGATDSSYTTDPITETKDYFCRVSDGYGVTREVWFRAEVDSHFSAQAVQQDVYVPLGETATLEVTATSDDPDRITYEWRALQRNYYEDGNYWTDWVVIDGATESSYVTGPVTERTEYYCYVYDGYGNVRSIWFNVNVETHFTAQAVQESVYVAPGETATLEVAASSDEPDKITYQWRVLQKHYDVDGSYWNEWSDIEGATGSSYVTAPVTERTQYSCVVEDGYGRSEEIWFGVYVETHFTAEPVEQSVTVGIGETATLEVAASSDDPDKITYQWRSAQKHYYEDGGYWNEWSDIEGATNSSYVTLPITERAEYSCRVSDGYGYSTEIWFSVYLETHFTAQAEDDRIAAPFGETPVLQVIASSDDPGKITYQWYKGYKVYYNDTDYSWTWSEEGRIDGAVSDSLTADPVTEYAVYVCRVSDGYGNNTTIWIYVYPETHLSARPAEENPRAPLGETATLEVIASSDIPEKISYQWYSTNNNWVKIEGATDSSYVTEPVTGYTRYVCRVYDGFGNSTDVWFSVSVETHFTVKAVQQNVSVSPNETATLEVIASSDDPDKLSYQWCILVKRTDENGGSWSEWVDIEGATDSSYVTDPITEYTQYFCRVSDGYGGSDGIDFQVRIETHFVAYAVNSDVYVPLNSQAELEVIASSDVPEKITYQWSYEVRHYGEDGGWWSEWVEIEGATGSSLTTDPVTESRTYRCQVSDGYGYTVEIWFYVYIDTHFNTWTEQSTVTVAPGETATLEMFATSDDPDKITYQWFTIERHDNPDGGYWNEWIEIEGATESSYTTGPVTKRQQYGCRVEDGYGSNRNYDFTVTIDYTSQIPTLAQPLALNTPTDAVIEGDCEYAFYYFIPEETDEYILSSFCTNDDTYVHLYNSSLEEINYNDDGGEGTNFHLEATLTAGETYYYGVRFYDRSSGTIPILLTRSNHLTARPNGNSDLRLPYGETAELSVIASATDASMITYRWYRLGTVVHTDPSGYSWESREWIPIEGETGSSYTTPAVTEYVQYRCTVEDGYGGLVNVWFSIRIETHFTARAAERDVKVPFGNTAVLEVIAESDVPDKITYQWYRAYKSYYSDNNWGWNYNDDTILTGETSSTLTIPEIKEYQAFACQVSDGFGIYETIWFYVSVDTGFKAWNEQSVYQVAPDSELTLEAFASSDSPELITYQWYEYDYNTGNNTKLEGETGSTYATGPVTATRRLECRVSDGYGAEVRLLYTVNLQTHFTAYAAERIVTVPMNGTVTLQVIANSDRPEKISYRWYDDSGNLVESETGPTLTAGPLTKESLFSCVVSDGYGSSIYVSFSIRIDTGIYAYAKETPIFVDPGEKAVLEVVAGANDPFTLSYSWVKYEKYVYAPGDWDWGVATPLENETGPSLTTEEIDEQSRYVCQVSDGVNDPIWVDFDIFVDSGFAVQLEESLQTVYVPYGQTVQLNIPAVSNYPDQLSYQWYVGNLISPIGYDYWLDQVSEVAGATEATLTTGPVTGPIGYRCIVDDGFGNTAIIEFHVFVQTNLSARAEQANILVSMGDTATARVIASSDDPEKISYQWFEFRPLDPAQGPNASYVEEVNGATGAELQLSDIRSTHELGCLVSDGYGNKVMVHFNVVIQNHLSAEAVNPVNYIGVNDRVELKVKVQGDDLTGLSYAWYRWVPMGYGDYYNYVQIQNADGSSLTVGPECEEYCCTVTDRYGTRIMVNFEVHIREENPDGYSITVTDYTKGKAETSLDLDARYSGEVSFTVSCDKAALVAVKTAEGFTLLKCTTENGEHRFTLTVTGDTELVVAIKGDTNLNGSIEMRDATLVSQVKNGAYSSGDGLSSLTADINGNGRVETRDATLICQARNGGYNVQW